MQLQRIIFPVEQVKVTEEFSTKHYAVDLAYGKEKKSPIYAVHDGTVEYSSYSITQGNFIQIKWNEGDYTLHARVEHCSSKKVKKGEKVKRGQLIAYIGNTGTATSSYHCHYELAITPRGKGYTTSKANRKKYAVNPLLYTYIADWQEVKPNAVKTQSDWFLYFKRIPEILQVEVEGDLNCRLGPGTNHKILGSWELGLYTPCLKKTVNTLDWYECEPDRWVAHTTRLKVLEPEGE